MRLPILPTVIVGLAIAAMVALGVWQLDRREQKAAALAHYAANIGAPAVPFPLNGIGDDALFRTSSLTCTRLTSIRSESGRDATGRQGWRIIADCVRAGGGTAPIQLGVARQPDLRTAPATGRFTGFISHAPDHRPLLAGIFDHAPKRLMLVARTPPAGLAANPGPDLSAVPNNHLAYAVQWFLFAAIALIIYAIALARRQRR